MKTILGLRLERNIRRNPKTRMGKDNEDNALHKINPKT